MRNIVAPIVFIACLSIAFAVQEKPSRQQNQPEFAQSPAPRASTGEIKALREELERMKELERQMESNLAFVDTTQSPLKHQFQLEIDMWRTMIASMERRLSTMSH